MSKNTNLHRAKKAKNDEFYTRYEDIEKELKHYAEHFEDKVVYCNCDDSGQSEFVHYFLDNFKSLKLKKLLASGYPKGIYYEYDGVNGSFFTSQDGDFRSVQSIELLKQADIVCTNPPFSLFKEYIAQLFQYDKKFLIIGNKNAITYKEVFPYIKDNKLWKGITSPGEFRLPDKTFATAAAWWFTNLPHKKRNEPIILTEKYDPKRYPKYDNYDAINVDKTLDIPMDYDGVMGVPISFLDKYCPEQFEIVSFRKGEDGRDVVFSRERESSTVLSSLHQEKIIWLLNNPKDSMINGKPTYARILIRRLNQ